MKRDAETVAKIMELRDGGTKIQDIADYFGVSKERIYQIAGAELKAWQAEHNPPKAKEKISADIRTIRRWMQEGMSVQEIADKCGCSRQNIYQKIKEDERKKMSRHDAMGLDVVRGVGQGEHRLIDPETGFVVDNRGKNATIIGRMGDEKVTQFVRYHMEMLAMRQGVDKRDVEDLYMRFARYLDYCAEHGIIPNNMNAYLAIGISRDDMTRWRTGKGGTPEQQKFAEDLTAFFASVHEQGATDGIVNPIFSMWLQKAHDHLVEASKLEVVNENPLGDKKSAAEIAKAYTEVNLPD